MPQSKLPFGRLCRLILGLAGASERGVLGRKSELFMDFKENTAAL